MKSSNPKIHEIFGQNCIIWTQQTTNSQIYQCLSKTLRTNLLVEEAADVWAESFRKLGLESTDFKDFDSDFYEKVKSTVENLNQESKNSNFNKNR